MILALTLAQAAPPAAAAEKTGETAAAAKPEKAKKVCVEEAQMGSHFKRRICATPEEWEKRRLQDQAEMSKRGASCRGANC